LFEQKYPQKTPAFKNPFEANKQHDVQLHIQGSIFHVNRGLLRIHGSLDLMPCMEEGRVEQWSLLIMIEFPPLF
jgi:hypothetical protein